MINITLAFSFILDRYPERSLATHAIAKDMIAKGAGDLDAFLTTHGAFAPDIDTCLASCITSLPPSVQQTVLLDVGVATLRLGLTNPSNSPCEGENIGIEHGHRSPPLRRGLGGSDEPQKREQLMMNVGISFFQTNTSVDSAVLAKHAEDLGFESYWVPEHVVLPVHTTSRFPGSPDGAVPDTYGRIVDPSLPWRAPPPSPRRSSLGTGICLVRSTIRCIWPRSSPHWIKRPAGVSCSASGRAGTRKKAK